MAIQRSIRVAMYAASDMYKMPLGRKRLPARSVYVCIRHESARSPAYEHIHTHMPVCACMWRRTFRAAMPQAPLAQGRPHQNATRRPGIPALRLIFGLHIQEVGDRIHSCIKADVIDSAAKLL